MLVFQRNINDLFFTCILHYIQPQKTAQLTWNGMVILGHRYPKSTFGANKLIWAQQAKSKEIAQPHVCHNQTEIWCET